MITYDRYLIFLQKHQAENGDQKHTSIVFSLKEEVGSLSRALKLFEVLQMSCSQIRLVVVGDSLMSER